MYAVQVSIVVCLLLTNVVHSHDKKPSQPHIVIIMVDDMGWNDVSFHGANQIPTPNIDALAYNGVILNRFYTLPSCTPSRTALLTGQYPMRLGFQGLPMKAGENRHLPHDVSILPEKLKQLGYSTNLIGKWHLGSAYKNVTPTGRGFDNHFGYWHGYIGYFDYQAIGDDMIGLDMHNSFEPQWPTQNHYATHLFTEQAEEVISTHDSSTPLFLMVSHLAVHTGTTGRQGSDLEVPDVAENDKKFSYIEDENRRRYAGMVDELDKSVGRTVEALLKKGILNDTIIVILSDNGAPSPGNNLMSGNWGSNWPLRGRKMTVMEGGVRNLALLYSSQLKSKGKVSYDLMHITDLMPTLYAAAGGDVHHLGEIDGINQWPTFTTTNISGRTEILLNIDEINNSSGLIAENGRFKLVNGAAIPEQYDGFFGEDGRGSLNPPYNVTAVLQSVTNIAISSRITENEIWAIRNVSDLGDCRLKDNEVKLCTTDNICLFDLVEDPCETTNLAEVLPEIREKLNNQLLEYRKQIQPQKVMDIDPRANPIYFNNTWSTWLEDSYALL